MDVTSTHYCFCEPSSWPTMATTCKGTNTARRSIPVRCDLLMHYVCKQLKSMYAKRHKARAGSIVGPQAVPHSAAKPNLLTP